MQIQKLTSTDGFIAFDLGDAPAVGVVRVAPKVLRDGAELLARSTTYAAASFGLSVGGGSAGINAKPDARDDAVAAFLGEVAELVESGRWLPGAGVGITVDELAGLPKADLRAAAFDPIATGESAVAAALGVLGSLDGKRIAVVGSGPSADAAVASASENGATAESGAAFDAECDALLVAGKAGVLEHDLAGTVRATAVVPLAPVPVTARALAVLGRAEIVVVPDFLSLAGPLLTAMDPDGADPMERVHDAVAAIAGEGTGLWMAAVRRAEDHLRAWQDALPFGRPRRVGRAVPRPFRFGLQCKGAADGAGWAELARKAEDLGWSVLTVADHFDEGMAPIPALMAAADATSTIRLGTMVLANDYRHPVVVAKEAATVDLLSGGRLELGIGAGWTTKDYEEVGIPLDRPGVRIARLAEAIDVIRGLWSDGPFTFTGEHYRITELDGLPKPAQPTGPPIVVGGGGERVLRLAARQADVIGINVNLAAGVIDERAFPDGVPDVTDRKLAWIRESAADRFDQLELQVRVHLAMVTDDRVAVIDELSPAFGLTAEEASQTPHALIGSVDEICDQLIERRDRWGISYLGMSGDQLLPFAPVVQRLAGT